MPIDTSVIGKVSGRRVVAVDRAPVANFARAVKDTDPVYRDPRTAQAAGLADIPAPPTFPFAMAYWGTYPELQEGLEPVGDNPMWE
ncbi:MAG: FAS1-like dehydratase domain-containing protein, partial [Acidimicrobiales bacterium]